MVEAIEAAHTTLGKGCTIDGQLNFEGTVQIDGQVEGEITAQETVLIGETAVVKARVTADFVVISGTVTGDVTARRRLEIKAQGRVAGNITAPSLIVHDGATFEGNCSMTEARANAKPASSGKRNGAQDPSVVLPPTKSWTDWQRQG